ncbi:MAG: 30S ribosomal protein S5 [Candidatus Paceibacterota bacterium]|jgi:small subunit ribosomal protein S5
MDTETTKINDATVTTENASAVKPAFKAPVGSAPFRKPVFGQRPPYGGMRSKNPRKGGPTRPERVKPEFEQKILNIRRVTRVTSGGKRLNFSVYIVAGDKKGKVGVGTGKANDTSVAIEKAYRNARKNMITLNLTKDMSIPHEVSAKYCSGRIVIMPTPGRGNNAGSAVRSVIELAGVRDITAKIISPSKNKLNMARATILALSAFDKKKFVNKEAENDKEVAKVEVKK